MKSLIASCRNSCYTLMAARHGVYSQIPGCQLWASLRGRVDCTGTVPDGGVPCRVLPTGVAGPVAGSWKVRSLEEIRPLTQAEQ